MSSPHEQPNLPAVNYELVDTVNTLNQDRIRSLDTDVAGSVDCAWEVIDDPNEQGDGTVFDEPELGATQQAIFDGVKEFVQVEEATVIEEKDGKITRKAWQGTLPNGRPVWMFHKIIELDTPPSPRSQHEFSVANRRQIWLAESVKAREEQDLYKGHVGSESDRNSNHGRSMWRVHKLK